jgi:2-polyprenyl-3-methyl-5-hydroxy-6-metoxy-1,4-benzoquinol methylase
LTKIYPKSILDVGTGTTALPHLIRGCGFVVTATDNVREYWAPETINRHYHIVDDDITKTKLNKKFDLISCVSVLEHIENADAAISNMIWMLNSKGYLILTMPYNEKNYIKNVYELEGASYGKNSTYIAQSFSRNEIDKWVREWKLEIVDQEYWKFWDGDYWTLGNQIIPPHKVSSQDKHQLTCILFRRIY